ncbi:MAG: RimK family alpha-L-glutamate ligase, partial [Rhizobiales bacterium]|nr:RimK family alpha-L-glutamate ligase [Hyphomicrobiales bacterium]
PTEFDWRIGVLGAEPLFAVQYLMAKKHWQIVNHDRRGKPDEGGFRTFTLQTAPAAVIDTAVRAARCIGDGLYGVDLKETADGVFVIEVNDNPNLDHGCEDSGEKDQVWARLTQWFIDRLERQGR